MRYDTVFLDVDGTLLWMDLDVEGYVGDLAPYATNGSLTAEKAAAPVWASVKRHINENIKYSTEEELARFKRSNAEQVARQLGVEAPPGVLASVADRRISFNPYPESESVMEKLREMGLALYVVSNWDVLLGEVLENLGWSHYFDGIVVSALVGVEKPGPCIFEEALRLSGRSEARERVVHVGNDPIADVRGAKECGLDAVWIDRGHGEKSEEATFRLPDLNGLPRLLRESGA